VNHQDVDVDTHDAHYCRPVIRLLDGHHGNEDDQVTYQHRRRQDQHLPTSQTVDQWNSDGIGEYADGVDADDGEWDHVRVRSSGSEDICRVEDDCIEGRQLSVDL